MREFKPVETATAAGCRQVDRQTPFIWTRTAETDRQTDRQTIMKAPILTKIQITLSYYMPHAINFLNIRTPKIFVVIILKLP